MESNSILRLYKVTQHNLKKQLKIYPDRKSNLKKLASSTLKRILQVHLVLMIWLNKQTNSSKRRRRDSIFHRFDYLNNVKQILMNLHKLT